MNGVTASDLMAQIQSYRAMRLDQGEDPASPVNIRRFLEAHCKITDTAGNRINLICNPAQIVVHDIAEQMLVDLGLVREAVEKIRQLGISTYIQNRFFTIAYNRPLITGLTVAHIQGSSDWLYGMSRFSYEELPRHMKAKRPLVSRVPTQDKIEFLLPHGSKLLVGTARSLDIGHAPTLQLFHGSEVARWPNPELLMEGISNALHYVALTEKWLETTAAPGGRYFKKLFEDALDGKNEYRAVFLGLLKFCYYSIPAECVNRPKTEWRQDEIKYQADHDIPDNIMDFVIWKKRSDACGDRWAPFNRQFPFSHEIAWDSPDECMFNLEALKAIQKEEIREPLRKVDLEFDGEEVGSTVKPVEGGLLPLWEIYEEPQDGAHYIVTSDWAEGTGGDYHLLIVFRIIQGGRWPKLEQVAHAYNNIAETYVMALEAYKIGVFYNWAYQCPEANKEGLLATKTLQKGFAGWPQTEEGYPYIYTQIKQQSKDEKPMEKFGWYTGGSTKKLMIETLRIWIVQRQLIIRCQRTLDELMGFYWDAEKKDYVQTIKHDDAKTYHDDEVVAMAIAPQAYAEWAKAPRLLPRAKGYRI